MVQTSIGSRVRRQWLLALIILCFAPAAAGHRQPAVRRNYTMPARNLLNHTNPGPMIGNITSRLSLGSKGDRGNP